MLLILLLAMALPAAAQPVPIDSVSVIAGGGDHTCAAIDRGGARCWGANFLGQLGDDTRTGRLLAVNVRGLNERLLAFTAGDDHSCALLEGGIVKCWGLNFYGQLGDGSRDLALTPVTTSGLGSGVQQIGAGENHSCALTAAGGVKCWGANYSGQLGDGSNTDRTLPVDVPGLTSDVREIAVGHRHTCAVTTAGAVKCWGFNFFGQLGDGSSQDRLSAVDTVGLGSGVEQIAAGGRHTCALRTGDVVNCWGANGHFQLANDGDENSQLTPTPVIGLSGSVTAMDLGGDHSCVLLGDGTVKCWGRNDVGQLGNGDNARSGRPVDVVGLLPGVKAIAIGQEHGCALQADSTLRCWGLNFSGQLGDGGSTQSFAPRATAQLPGPMQAVSVGEEHSCALANSGAVLCWGLNFFGQLGDGTQIQRLLPVAVSGLNAGVSAIAIGGFHGCALRAGGVSCWGANAFGQLGNGSSGDQTTAVAVQGLGDSVQAITAGGLHSCALRDGGVRCWGHNFAGQLGDGSDQFRLSPVAVVGLGSGVRSIAAGVSAHTCAITTAGGLRCWGANERGQLGDGTRSNRLVPVDVQGLSTGVQAVALGAAHTCALLSGGAVRCWGSNDILQLGNEVMQDQLTPLAVVGLESGVTALALGRTHSCARLAQGNVRCWGRNDFGQLGDGSSLNRPAPVPVTGLGANVNAISAAAEHSCALLTGGSIRCWGSNYSGQFGNGEFGGRPVPVVVKRDRDLRRRPTPPVDAAITSPASNASGQFLVFESRATNLIPADSNGSRDVFRVDTYSGEVRRVSVDNSGAQLMGDAGEAAISADGQQVVFVAPDAAVGALLGENSKRRQARQKGGQAGVFLRNLLTGSTQRVGTAMSEGSAPQLDQGATALVFTAPNSNPALGPTNRPQVFLQSLTPQAGGGLPAPRCLSCKAVTSNGSDSAQDTDGEASAAVISGDGRHVAWQSTAKNVLAGVALSCPDAASNVVLRNLLTGSMQVVSAPAAGGSCGVASNASMAPSIDFDGDKLVFQSDQPLVAGDDNQLSDVYLRDVATGGLLRLSQTSAGAGGNAPSAQPTIAGDGGSVVFRSEARNLVAGNADNNEVADVLAWSGTTGSLQRVSSNALGDQADALSDQPVLNFSGSLVAFQSDASNLLLGAGGVLDGNGLTDVFQTANPLAGVPLKTATWWKQSESGWGLHVIDQGNLLAPAWFTYDVDGEPTWFLVGGAFAQVDGSFAGDLFQYTGVPFAQIVGPAADPANSVGAAVLRFSGDQSLQFSYSVNGVAQTKSMTRFPFGSRDIACRASADASRQNAGNFSDIWWGGETTPGWGLILIHLDSQLFAVWYTYDQDREAVFFVIPTTQQADGSFSGGVFRQANGTPFSMINDTMPSAGSSQIGTASFRFSDGANGVFSYSVGAVTQSKPISRFQVGTVAASCETTAVSE
ncbi:MAG: RCC1 domain-containing protein [Pseudomarimonas sp.]